MSMGKWFMQVLNPALLLGGLPNGEDISFSSMSGLLEMLLWHS